MYADYIVVYYDASCDTNVIEKKMNGDFKYIT